MFYHRRATPLLLGRNGFRNDPIQLLGTCSGGARGCARGACLTLKRPHSQIKVTPLTSTVSCAAPSGYANFSESSSRGPLRGRTAPNRAPPRTHRQTQTHHLTLHFAKRPHSQRVAEDVVSDLDPAFVLLLLPLCHLPVSYRRPRCSVRARRGGRTARGGLSGGGQVAAVRKKETSITRSFHGLFLSGSEPLTLREKRLCLW